MPPLTHSRSPHGSQSTSHSWMNRSDLVEYSFRGSLEGYEEPNDGDEESSVSGQDLVEVSKETRELLTTACTHSIPNEVRKNIRQRYPLSKVPATRYPNRDTFIKPEVPSAVKAADKDLAIAQSFVLDSLVPLTKLVEHGLEMSDTAIKDATIAAIQLIGNANARISRPRQEKVLAAINRLLLPLEEAFFKSAPALFGADFGKRSKEYLDQVRAMRSAIPQRSASEGGQRTFYKPRGLPVRREQYTHSCSYAHRGRDRGPKGARSESAVRICSQQDYNVPKTTMYSL